MLAFSDYEKNAAHLERMSRTPEAIQRVLAAGHFDVVILFKFT